MKTPSLEELKTVRAHILTKIDMVALVSKYANSVEPISSTNFTHRCRCPSLAHKGGQERTPSFYFSSTAKNYYCHGCNIFGSALDFLALMSGTPWTNLCLDYMRTHSLSVDSLPPLPIQNNPDVIRKYLFESNLAFAEKARIFLSKIAKGGRSTNSSLEWLEKLYAKIDAKFIDLTNIRLADVKSTFLQAEMELMRKYADLGLKYEDSERKGSG